MEELKNALKAAGLDRAPVTDVFGFDPDCDANTCQSGCTNCQPGCFSCSPGNSKGGSS